ncbi:unnamed protein product [Moneuplotes crassus]|uniref:Protein kinase domain-containing protein n=1 Tax=Euplotes crassus TaxID=5936 RepID=A0AAD1X8M0_EUPCR|nr:unnamed protein product [Moneuplotes crassus]
MEIIIGDLGFAKSLNDTEIATSWLGTPVNMAPEILNKNPYTSKIDIWSLGIMVYELLVGFTPFVGRRMSELTRKVNKGEYGVPQDINLSLSCIDFLSKCLQLDPIKRISHCDILNHPFLEEDDDSERVNLSVSMDLNQSSFFEIPTCGFEITDTNAVMFAKMQNTLSGKAQLRTICSPRV